MTLSFGVTFDYTPLTHYLAFKPFIMLSLALTSLSIFLVSFEISGQID
jgi:hypothetical protein